MPTVSNLVIDYLRQANIEHVFGIPGDYILGFYSKLYNSDIKVINTTDEAGSGFAADVYARLKGVGCLCVTYNVGALKVANAIAGAYAERSPVVVISGSPGLNERKEDFLLHHTSGDYDSQMHVFKNITCASVVIDNPATAKSKLEFAFSSLNFYKQPVFIEIPRDIANKEVSLNYSVPSFIKPVTDEKEMAESFNYINDELKNNPVILAGVEVSRFGFDDSFLSFVERNNIPVITTLLGKSLIPESHPLHKGIYTGKASKKEVRGLIDSASCIFMLGAMVTDLTMSFMPPSFSKEKVISCSFDEGLYIGYSHYPNVLFVDFMKKLLGTSSSSKVGFKRKNIKFLPEEGKSLTTKRFFEKVNSILDERFGVIADVGDCLFGSSDLTIVSEKGFIGGAFYASMGLAIPGALAMQIARNDLRPIVLVGDGSFQMSAVELGTIILQGLNPIVLVLNNKGYTTERFLMEGGFNDILNWEYHKIVQLFGKGKGFKVETEKEFSDALDSAILNDELHIINAVVAKDDISPALKRVTDALSKRI